MKEHENRMEKKKIRMSRDDLLTSIHVPVQSCYKEAKQGNLFASVWQPEKL